MRDDANDVQKRLRGLHRQSAVRRDVRQEFEHVHGADARAALPRLLARHDRDRRIDPSFIVAHRFLLSQGAEAYSLFSDRSDGCVKVVLDPSARAGRTAGEAAALVERLLQSRYSDGGGPLPGKKSVVVPSGSKSSKIIRACSSNEGALPRREARRVEWTARATAESANRPSSEYTSESMRQDRATRVLSGIGCRPALLRERGPVTGMGCLKDGRTTCVTRRPSCPRGSSCRRTLFVRTQGIREPWRRLSI